MPTGSRRSTGDLAGEARPGPRSVSALPAEVPQRSEPGAPRRGRRVPLRAVPALDRVGIALAGGGPQGAVWEIGALCALDEAVEGLDLNHLGAYVGVSAGSFICACLANQLSARQMCRAIVKGEPGEHPFVPETFFKPALGELVRRGLSVPGLALDGLLGMARGAGGLDVLLGRLATAIPSSVFDNEPIRRYLERIYNLKGRTDDFRELGCHLAVVASDLESGRAVRFGEPGFDHVPISRAVQASTALPGLYPPVEIDGRYYVDGVLHKTLHASVALDAGADLVICVNPLVPVDLSGPENRPALPSGFLVGRGLSSVLSQTFRTLIHSRMAVGLKAYENRYQGADVVLFEPRPDDYRMFFTNIFTFSSRKAVCEHAYRAVRGDMLRRCDHLSSLFARHGLRLNREVLERPPRDLWGGAATSALASRLDHVLDRLEDLIEERNADVAAPQDAA